MANIKSSKKDTRRTASRTERNKTVRSRIKTLAKKVETSGDKESASSLASAVDKAIKSGVVHPNKAARIKSRLAKKVFAAKK